MGARPRCSRPALSPLEFSLSILEFARNPVQTVPEFRQKPSEAVKTRELIHEINRFKNILLTASHGENLSDVAKTVEALAKL